MWGQLCSQRPGNYNPNVILSKPRVVSASGTRSGLNTTQFYIQMCHLIELKREILHASFSASSFIWICNHNSRWVNIVVVARAPDLNVIHPSAVEMFLWWVEKQSLLVLSRTKPEQFRTAACVKMGYSSIISDEVGKCWPAGENGTTAARRVASQTKSEDGSFPSYQEQLVSSEQPSRR